MCQFAGPPETDKAIANVSDYLGAIVLQRARVGHEERGGGGEEETLDERAGGGVTKGQYVEKGGHRDIKR